MSVKEQEFQNLINIISSDFSQLTPIESENLLKVLIKEIDKYLQEVQILREKYETEKEKIQNIENTLSSFKVAYKAYTSLKKMHNNNNNMQSLLTKGYILTHKIREMLTGQTITYSLGIPYYNQLHTITLSMENILKYFKVNVSSSGDLQLIISKSAKKMMVDADNHIIEKHIQLYEQVFAYKEPDRKHTKGHSYEVYLNLRKNRNIKYRSKESVLQKAYNAVIANTASGLQGGDIGLQQVKYLGNASASVMSLTNILNTLTDFNNALKQFLMGGQHQDFKKIVMENFVKQVVDSKLEQDLKRDAIKHIDSFIKQIKN
jgi:hypothetical protein